MNDSLFLHWDSYSFVILKVFPLFITSRLSELFLGIYYVEIFTIDSENAEIFYHGCLKYTIVNHLNQVSSITNQ